MRFSEETTGHIRSGSRFVAGVRHEILNIVFIVLAWVLFLAAMIYPVLHLVGLLICGIAILRGTDERGWSSRDRVLKIQSR